MWFIDIFCNGLISNSPNKMINLTVYNNIEKSILIRANDKGRLKSECDVNSV